MIPIRLEPSEQIWAQRIAHERFTHVDGKGKPRFPGATERDHQVGAAGELAFSKLLGVRWPETVDTFTSVPDVPPNWEVRTSPKTVGVKVTDTDPDDRLVVWLRGEFVRFEVMGFIRAGGAKQHPEWKRDPGKRGRAAWWVPPARMIPIDPGWHSVCAYEREDWGPEWPPVWRCAFCNAYS